MSIKTTTLDSGLRIITDSVPEMETVALGVWADVGTRHEDLKHNGVAHMVEHMMFNGTPTRTSLQIAEAIEDVGGQINAYTSREITAYYIHLLKNDMPLAMDILSDILQRPTFPDAELEKERGVILQEIGMTNDTPDDVVFDHYQETAYPDQALGAPILGREDIIQNMKKETLYDYVHRFYTPKKLVISAAGNIDHDAFVHTAQTMFSDLPKDSDQSYTPARYKGGEVRVEKDLEQSHVVLGFRGINREDPDYYSAVMLGTILGGGISSRLFQEVREKRGLVYSIYSSHSSYHDDGQFEIYAGTGPESLNELVPVTCTELVKVMQNPVTEAELNRAKAQIKAGILMSRESMLSRANRQAKYFINFNRAPDVAKLIAQVDAVTVYSVQKIAQKIFTGKPTLAALGPVEGLEDYEKITQRLAA
ncbi:MAG: peptidase M16 [Micavibrio aeruginosavorus]|uniref:Peptidase M16 n=1 Tax=Micavibrio aeruginosavorus TaxID=349221 RepID=A0A2W5N6U1_9BACT|nr:MAG: peptidase M16 [Micavibrio aeruginosavorus]